MLWEVDIYPAVGEIDRAALRLAAEAKELGIGDGLTAHVGYGYLLEGELDAEQVGRVAREILADPIVERAFVAPVGDASLLVGPDTNAALIHVLPKPGVMDPIAESTLKVLRDERLAVKGVRTFRKYWIGNLQPQQLSLLAAKVLANDAIEQVVSGPLHFDRLEVGRPYTFEKLTVKLDHLDDDGLMRLSREGQLYLQLAEMQTIQKFFRELGRDPSDAELETVAQTWSEHCSHKTLAGRIQYRGPEGERQFDNMLRETIFAATQQIRKNLGDADWCVSVFKDNAGVVLFNDDYHAVFKVETHNHPSALEPYGGANTGLGGVIRDPLGTGMGAKPICNTDVFCFAPPDTPAADIPPGVLHPHRVLNGVVSGVRDYGNRMGIPTVNGAVYFDPRYLGNPLVYCGNVGILPRDKAFKQVKAGDHIVAVGGRTGRDGIHGATFSSAELTSQSESLSGGAVQIGNAITEKMVLDVILEARDRELYNAITDCGAGGFSSAVGEMGEELGAVVWLDRCPVKYEGLSYTEIWISEAQERMVLSVSEQQWPELSKLCESEGVEATVIGQFLPTGRLQLMYHGEQVADLDMHWLHEGRPPVIRQAEYQPAATAPLSGTGGSTWSVSGDQTKTLTAILGSLNVASKEWIVRQYDHEVQGGSVIKPLVGVCEDGPGDAAVVRPCLDSRRGLVISCGMNPRYGDLDTGAMAASAIDEAVRNCVAVGADPSRIAILDNFCWGDCEKPQTLGSLVRAALVCQDVAVTLGTPFISGKDSLNNEFRWTDDTGSRQSLAIPPSLLISAMGQVDDVARCVTMDLKSEDNVLYLVGVTKNELGGSHYSLVRGLTGGQVPQLDAKKAKATFAAVHRAIHGGAVRACHDLSEGGLAAAAAEMAFAGGLGAKIYLAQVPHNLAGEKLSPEQMDALLLFSESNTRFLCEVPAELVGAFEAAMEGVRHAAVGEVLAEAKLIFVDADPASAQHVIDADLAALKQAWQKPLAF